MSLAEKLLNAYKYDTIDDVLNRCDSWEMLYHLSPMRQNLLEWYEFKDNAAILEVGAQAGGLTGFFAARAKALVALEKDSELLEVNKVRNRGCENTEFRLGTMEDLKIDEMFDYIILIGTLEQAYLYCDKKNSTSELLKICKQHLKQDGVLIIAGDNKTGMKYWAGAPDHVNGKVFLGITNNYKSDEPRSFSKIEYEDMLNREGFSNLEFYYPTPDYRFVSSLYSDNYLPQMGELRPGNKVYEQGGYQFFEESLAYDTVCKDGNYPYFAESFLIFADNKK